MRRRLALTPFRITAIYVVIGGLWVLFSDVALVELVDDPELRLRLHVAKGWLFVAVTGMLIFCLTRTLTNALITEDGKRRNAKAALRTALIQAERASMAKSEFLAAVSHEFRTPLNAIIGFSELLRAELFGPLSIKYAEYADHIHVSGLLIKKLIDNMLAVVELDARKRPVERESLDLRPLLAQCLERFRAWSEEVGISASLDLTGAPETLYADRSCVIQIVSNLLANAVASTDRGGRVILSVASDDTGAIIAVTDSGGGIPAERLPTIAEPFSNIPPDPTLAHDHSGLGLGLAIVKSLAETHGGTLRVTSELGKGTTAAVWFPALSIDD